ncbi:MAG: glycosyltransferase [Verrucomicrobiaceae bacterium]|nr:MAG: glycosyltransferase [Verrucomicrobiaceae bacterium]
MRVAISATNPCHLWDLARELSKGGTEVDYYSGYPKWRLPHASSAPGGPEIHCSSARTLATYGLLRVPERYRPANDSLFRWQDEGFDRAISRRLRQADFIHGMPGQCLATFRRAKEMGILRILNHASGPVEDQERIMDEEHRRHGRARKVSRRFDATYFAKEREEYELADFHCVASTLVRDQLVARSIDPERIIVVPYGADPLRFPKRQSLASSGAFRIVFAGNSSLRKGIPDLLGALEKAGGRPWECHFLGHPTRETEHDFQSYCGQIPLIRQGALSQQQLAEEFQKASVLVLPSAEEAFGLVVVQALQCGVPCIVSDRVGAKDLIQHRRNGSILSFPTHDVLLDELEWWATHPMTVSEPYDWALPAQAFMKQHLQLLSRAPAEQIALALP